MTRHLMLLLPLVFAAVPSGCGGPVAGDTPDETADRYARLRVKEELEKFEADLEKWERELDKTQDQMGLWADRGRKRIANMELEAKIRFWREHWDEISDAKFDIVKIRETDKTTREVTIRFYWREPKPFPDGKGWFLGRKPTDETKTLSLIGGKWRIVQ